MNELHKQIFELFRLLDNIDTASDMYKDNYKGLAKYVYKQQQKRWEFINEKQVNELYAEYMPDLEVEE